VKLIISMIHEVLRNKLKVTVKASKILNSERGVKQNVQPIYNVWFGRYYSFAVSG